MEQMGTEMTRAEESIGDPAKSEDTLRALSRLIQLSGASLLGQPKNMEDTPADGQAAHKLAFRREIVLLVRQLADIELLVLDGKHAEAAELFKVKIATARDAGHKKFGGDEEDAHADPAVPPAKK